MRQKLSPEALKQLRKQMRQMQNEITKLSNQSRAQMQIAEIKEVLRRAGKSLVGQKGARTASRRRATARTARARSGKNGQNGKGGKGAAAARVRRARRRQGLEHAPPRRQRRRQSTSALLLAAADGAGRQQQGQSGDGPRACPAATASATSTTRTSWATPRALSGKRHDTRVEGKEGAGPSRSQTILGSAEKGFASTSYKRVYGDYTAVVEEVMSKEKVPPGYRFYIKRYFQLIKPRE